MERAEQRAILKKLQGIVNGRADAEALEVLDELRYYVETFPAAEREEKSSRDRKERKGRTRTEG